MTGNTMTDDKSIFGPPFKSRESLQPAQEDMAAFLERVREEGSRASHASGLAAYRRLIEETEAFERGGLKGRNDVDIQAQMYYGVVGHAQFAHTALLSAVELYQYHLNALASLDFKNPSAFIKSAENEMGRLNKKKLSDVVRMARLQEMIAERKKILEQLRGKWMERAAELRRIVLYLRDNLSRIEKRCETAIVVLAELEIGRQKEKQLIEDIKTSYKVKFKEALHRGKTSRQDLESAKQELDMLTTEMSVHAREDADTLTQLYEAIHGHVRKTVQKLDMFLADTENKKTGGARENTKLFEQAGENLISLVSDYRIDPKPSRVPTDVAHRDLIREKRKEMLAYLFEQVRKERRARKDRRSLQDRRKIDPPVYPDSERRVVKDRRAAKNRRS